MSSLEVEVRRVLRGGSFGRVRESTRSAFRFRFNPRSRYDDYGFRMVVNGVDREPMHRVLRGGSFNHSRENVRPVHRYRNFPAGRSGYVGFRVMVDRVQERIEENDNA